MKDILNFRAQEIQPWEVPTTNATIFEVNTVQYILHYQTYYRLHDRISFAITMKYSVKMGHSIYISSICYMYIHIPVCTYICFLILLLCRMSTRT